MHFCRKVWILISVNCSHKRQNNSTLVDTMLLPYICLCFCTTKLLAVYIYNSKISRGICICVYIYAAHQHLQTGRWRVNNIMCVIYISMYYHLLVWNCNITNIQFILARSQFRYLLYFVYYMGDTGGRLNKKDGLTRYGDPHVKDKTS